METPIYLILFGKYLDKCLDLTHEVKAKSSYKHYKASRFLVYGNSDGNLSLTTNIRFVNTNDNY